VQEVVISSHGDCRVSCSNMFQEVGPRGIERCLPCGAPLARISVALVSRRSALRLLALPTLEVDPVSAGTFQEHAAPRPVLFFKCCSRESNPTVRV
jgi:hypothetical protein